MQTLSRESRRAKTSFLSQSTTRSSAGLAARLSPRLCCRTETALTTNNAHHPHGQSITPRLAARVCLDHTRYNGALLVCCAWQKGRAQGSPATQAPADTGRTISPTAAQSSTTSDQRATHATADPAYCFGDLDGPRSVRREGRSCASSRT